ncbi:hypothetical protein ANCCAN_23583 [Ancylostoma caninum]|uniref:Uncharacterized protein n=1 Tax=Ancylostoma caninum TaxID=29170 RepID=A0A368FKF6_ANCCA|nr:hypothetical protein ANCCAN_23583 [Ancylostoma caninum]
MDLRQLRVSRQPAPVRPDPPMDQRFLPDPWKRTTIQNRG